MAGIEPLIEELERSYADLQARLSDPAVYNDHREAADVGRRLKELETPHNLALDWLQARADLSDARRPRARVDGRRPGERHREARGRAQGSRSSSATRPTRRT